MSIQERNLKAGTVVKIQGFPVELNQDVVATSGAWAVIDELEKENVPPSESFESGSQVPKGKPSKTLSSLLHHLWIDWSEVVAINGVNPHDTELVDTNLEFIFKSGAKTTVNLGAINSVRNLDEVIYG